VQKASWQRTRGKSKPHTDAKVSPNLNCSNCTEQPDTQQEKQTSRKSKVLEHLDVYDLVLHLVPGSGRGVILMHTHTHTHTYLCVSHLRVAEPMAESGASAQC
jgi:hypothetical protein